MKTKLKMIFVVIMAIMLITVFTTSVKAEYSATVTMTPDKTNVKPGDIITVVVNLEDVVDAGTGASEMGGYVAFDKNFISQIRAKTGTWEMNDETGKFILSGNVLTEDGEFAILELTVNENATGTSYVAFSELATSDGTAEPSSPDITLTFNITDEENPGGDDNNPGGDDNNPGEDDNNPGEDDNNPGGDDNNPGGDNNNPSGDDNNPSDDDNDKPTGGDTNKNTIKVDPTENVTSQTKLPDAGMGIGMIIAGIALVVIIVASYMLYKRYQKV